MENSKSPLVLGKNGLRGRLLTALPEGSAASTLVPIEWENGERVQAPADVLVRQADGSYYLPLSRTDLEQAQDRNGERSADGESEVVVPVIQEEMAVEKRFVETGRVRITKLVHQHEETVDEPLLQQRVSIEHVPINRVWEGPAPAPRYEEGVLIVPLLEEVLVVEKRLMLKEELHISRVQRTVHEPQTVVLRSESIRAERVEPSGETPAEGTLGS